VKSKIIFGPEWEEVTDDRRDTDNDRLRKLCLSPNAVRTIESRRVERAEHATQTGDERAG
jgi:hypothetical protein